MILISHRGNINGKNTERENSPEYIKEALYKGYDVEIDIWYTDDWYLGHDEPTYKIDIATLDDYFEKLWFHCKNLEALKRLLRHPFVCCFWHETDSFTLTSNNYIWTYPDKELSSNSICVLPETFSYSEKDLKICAGICSDYIELFRKFND